jgi:hypothetical protein
VERLQKTTHKDTHDAQAKQAEEQVLMEMLGCRAMPGQVQICIWVSTCVQMACATSCSSIALEHFPTGNNPRQLVIPGQFL